MDDSPTHVGSTAPPGHRSALTLADLREIGRKGGRRSSDDPFWVSRVFYRPWTIYVTWLSLRLGLSANLVTLISAVAIFAAAILYLLPNPILWILGAILVQVYFVLDHVDGEVARFEREQLGRSSGMAGFFYDSCAHAGFSAMYAAIAIRTSLDMGGNLWVMLLAVLAFFPGAIRPWEKYCEAIVVHVRGKIDGDSALIPADAVGLPDERPSRSVRTWVRQLIGFPGWFVTLLICTLLDGLPGAREIEVGTVQSPFLLGWLILTGLQMGAANIRGTFQLAGKLKELK